MGLFSKKKNEEVAIDELTPQIKTKLDELAQKGNQFEEEEQYEEAIQAWKEALSLIPEPQQFYSETIWFLAAIGDIYFQKKQYEKAHECFDKARGNLSGEGYGNPFVMLRLGECCLEIGDEKNATEYLLRAYMFEGREIFEPDEDGKPVRKLPAASKWISHVIWFYRLASHWSSNFKSLPPKGD